ncbi:MAG TPA: protocadherin [Pirellulales bacterium]|nr:protocadherin [Pirellulales bacterium]
MRYRRSDFVAATILLGAVLAATDGLARGFGGFHGGGFGGGGFGGGGLDRGGFGGGGLDRDGFGGGGLDRGGFGGGEFDRGGFGGYAPSSPSRDQLNSFLGMPSGGGFRASGSDAFNVQRGAVEGPRGGYAAGASIEGPRGGEVARGVAVGPNGGMGAGRGAVGPGGAAAGQGVAMGRDGLVAGGSTVRGPYGSVAGRGFAARPGGVDAGFARVNPSGRYASVSSVRANFNNYGIYGAGWYGAHPGAWLATGWAAGAAWNAATWAGVGGWFAYGDSQPMFNYNYGDNIVYDNGNVYFGNQYAGTSAQYYDQAAALAEGGNQAATSNADWLPLGVFAFAPAGQKQSNVTVQLAVDKEGLVRGNYTDAFSGQPATIQGSVDKESQRVAWTVGDNKTNVFEAGLYNLTRPETPVLVHFGKERTEQWLLVRLKQPAPSAQPAAAAQPTSE